MSVINRDERIFSLGMKLRQVARVQFSRIFGTAPSTDGRYKAMIDLLERCYLMRSEINGLTKLLLDKGIISPGELQKVMEEEMNWYFEQVAKQFPEIEFGDKGFTIKDIPAHVARVKNENWPP